MQVLVALDLSLSCTGIVAASTGWGGHWGCVPSTTVACAKLLKLAKGEQRNMRDEERFDRVSKHAANVVHAAILLEGVLSLPVHFLIEQRAQGLARFDNQGNLAELHSLVKDQLSRAHISWDMVNMSSARKLILGTVPRKGEDAKNAVQASFRQAGCPVEWGKDQTDAMCVLNYGMYERDAFFFGVTT